MVDAAMSARCWELIKDDAGPEAKVVSARPPVLHPDRRKIQRWSGLNKCLGAAGGGAQSALKREDPCLLVCASLSW